MADIDIAASLGGGDFEFDSGFSGEFGIGYDFGKLRTEFTYNATNTDLTTVQGTTTDIGVDVSTWMVSAAYDWRADKTWQPYVGAGMGKSTIEVDLAQTIGNVAVVVDDDNITAFKFKAGVNYEASENIDVYGELWGQAFDDFTIGTLEFEDCGMTGVSLGLRYKL
jgi:outer membrane autotransporter protein